MNYKFETLQLHVGQEEPDPATDARAVPIYQTTSYVFRDSAHAAARFGLADAGNIYGRLTNSTQDVLEKRLAALEGGVAALATASGAAAITYTIQALAQARDHIVAQKTIYGGSYNLLAHTLPQYGIKTTFVDAHDLSAVASAIQSNTKAVYLETLGNPNSDIPDIDAVAEVDGQSRDAGAREFQHAVGDEAAFKGGLHQGDGHVVGPHAPLGRTGEVDQGHLGVGHVPGVFQKLLTKLRPALAHGHGAQGSVAGVGVGA